MPKAHGKARVHQVARWLRSRFPAPQRVRVSVAPLEVRKKNGCYADCDGQTIRVHDKLPPALATEALIHEWAHARTWSIDEEEHHGPIWAACYGEIYTAFYDSGGDGEADDC